MERVGPPLITALDEKYVLHRDLHTDNWMIEDGKAKLFDFGTAILLGENGYTIDGLYGNTTSPRECYVSEPYSFNSDVFGLAQGMFMMQDKIKEGPYTKGFHDLDAVVGVEAACVQRKKHRETEPTYG